MRGTYQFSLEARGIDFRITDVISVEVRQRYPVKQVLNRCPNVYVLGKVVEESEFCESIEELEELMPVIRNKLYMEDNYRIYERLKTIGPRRTAGAIPSPYREMNENTASTIRIALEEGYFKSLVIRKLYWLGKIKWNDFYNKVKVQESNLTELENKFLIKEQISAEELFEISLSSYAEKAAIKFIELSQNDEEGVYENRVLIWNGLYIEKTLDPERYEIVKTSLEKPRLCEETPVNMNQVKQRERKDPFRELVKDLYKNSCAVCNLSLRSPKGRPEVEGAHIYPKKHDGADDLRNGLALCHLHHWAFDSGWFSIGDDLKIIVRNDIPKTDGYKQISQWNGNTIHFPLDQRFNPHQLYLCEHRKLHGFE